MCLVKLPLIYCIYPTKSSSKIFSEQVAVKLRHVRFIAFHVSSIYPAVLLLLRTLLFSLTMSSASISEKKELVKSDVNAYDKSGVIHYFSTLLSSWIECAQLALHSSRWRKEQLPYPVPVVTFAPIQMLTISALVTTWWLGSQQAKLKKLVNVSGTIHNDHLYILHIKVAQEDFNTSHHITLLAFLMELAFLVILSCAYSRLWK